MAQICQFRFTISNWNIVCNKTLTPEDWQKGQSHWEDHIAHTQTISPKLAFLSPLKRRRLNEAARLFFESAWDLTAQHSNIPVVYASCNGEINRSFALWHTFLQDNEVSPTSFSLSVHNALVGQWSEIRQVKTETTAITAQKDNLEIALMEAYLLLNEGHKRVLVTVVETPLDPQYNVAPIERLPFGYALSMVVEQGEQFQLSLHTQAVKTTEISDSALSWVKHHYLETQQWYRVASRTGNTWLWQRNSILSNA